LSDAETPEEPVSEDENAVDDAPQLRTAVVAGMAGACSDHQQQKCVGKRSLPSSSKIKPTEVVADASSTAGCGLTGQVAPPPLSRQPPT
jgi:hypothetical protein